jgi:HTH-type transcriptional regulator / antitoxin HigA
MTKHVSNASVRYQSLAELTPDWIAKPGDTINDILQERGWKQTDLARRTGLSTKHVNQLLKSAVPITQDTAAKLEKVLGSTVRFWVTLEAQYQEQLARKQELKALETDIPWLKELPVNDMVKFGWVAKEPNKTYQVLECLKFYAVSSVDAWRTTYSTPVAAYRASPTLARNGAAVSAWLRQGEKLADTIICAEYDKNKFAKALAQVRTLTNERDPNLFIPRIRQVCADAGVAVVMAPAPKGCPVSGAAKWLTPTKALIFLSARGKSDDKLWFTFFHEAGHIVKHGKSLTFLDLLGDDSGLNPREEAEADAFARDYLIPQDQFNQFLAVGQFTRVSITRFAKQQQIAPGIVVGRLQHEKKILYSYLNELKVKYQWPHESENGA